MTVADMCHVVDTVQVRVSLFIVHVLAFAFDDFEWRLFEEERHRFA